MICALSSASDWPATTYVRGYAEVSFGSGEEPGVYWTVSLLERSGEMFLEYRTSSDGIEYEHVTEVRLDEQPGCVDEYVANSLKLLVLRAAMPEAAR